eukprot:GHVO01028825.1.p1 GENE.GHVO01028825.1~~GHVO01028825.1.p1  ORF type:complete len:163 (-),score=14.77 GHVO01028825.1:188-676(-)
MSANVQRQKVVDLEMRIFSRLGFCIPTSSSVHFLQAIIMGHEELSDKAAKSSDKRLSLYCCALLFLELGLCDFWYNKYTQEQLANAAACLALLCHSALPSTIHLTLPPQKIMEPARFLLSISKEVETKSPTSSHYAHPKRQQVTDLVLEKRSSIRADQIAKF